MSECNMKHAKASECPFSDQFMRRGPLPYSKSGEVGDYLDLGAYSRAHGATTASHRDLNESARAQRRFPERAPSEAKKKTHGLDFKEGAGHW